MVLRCPLTNRALGGLRSTEDCMWMWERAQLLGIPLMAGSSLPTLWRSPRFLEYPLDVELDEALSLGCEQPPSFTFCVRACCRPWRCFFHWHFSQRRGAHRLSTR